jgi:hypothetical protein
LTLWVYYDGGKDVKNISYVAIESKTVSLGHTGNIVFMIFFTRIPTFSQLFFLAEVLATGWISSISLWLLKTPPSMELLLTSMDSSSVT